MDSSSQNPKPMTPERKAFLRKWVVLFSALESLVETGIKLGAALLTGSVGLMADVIHSAVDVVGSLLVWVGVRIAPNKYRSFPYGFYKIENLLALAIGLAILFGAFEIFKIFLAGKSPLPSNVPIGVAAVLLGMALDFFWGRFEARVGREINSPGIEASGTHTLSDVFSSLVVLVGLLGSLFGYNLDRWAALIVSLMITRMGLIIIWDNVRVLLDIAVEPERLASYRKIIERQPGVLDVHAVRGRNSGSFRFVDAEVVVSAFEIDAAEAIAQQIEQALKEEDSAIDSAFIHYRHELPRQIKLYVPTDASGTIISDCFGKASHFSRILYDRQTQQVLQREVQQNPFNDEEEHRGIRLASHLIDQGADSVCCREDLENKGPGLMLHRFGIDLRRTEEPQLDRVLEDYLESTKSMFQPRG
ncbi:MAG: cation diffusion facilitator family transporter [Gammaproteobacteria bacterium SHHR-1]